MKRTLQISWIVVSLLCCVAQPVWGQQKKGKITMTTIASEGTEFSLAIAATANGTNITIDWGNGTPISYTAGTDYIECREPLKGKTVVIEGDVTKLNCISNKLTDLDISLCPSLEVLQVMYNYLSNLNVANNPNLVALECFSNQIKELQIDNLSKLIRLVCTNNFISSLDLSHAPELEYIDCAQNKRITELDLSQNNKLKVVLAYDCSLASLKLPATAPIIELACHKNKLPRLDLNYPKLTTLNASENLLTECNIKAPLLTVLNLSKNNLTSYDLTIHPSIRSAMFTGNPQLAQLKVGKSASLVELGMSDCKVASLDVTQAENLETIWFKNNQLQSIDFSRNNKLVRLIGGGNQLTTIQLPTQIDSLRYLQIPKNKINKIDVSKYVHLKTLDLSSNLLSEIALAQNKEISTLNLNANQLTQLDISKNFLLTMVGFSGNPLDVCQLDKIYEDLPRLEKKSAQINLFNGDKKSKAAQNSKTYLAEEKGWKPLIQGDGTGCIDSYEDINNVEIRSFVFEGTLWVYLSQGTEQIFVYDLQGNLVHTEKIEAGTHSIDIPRGNYIVTYAKGNLSDKVIL